MANGKEVNNTKVLIGSVETVVNPLLETVGGFTSEECVNAIKNKKMQTQVKAYAKAFMAGHKSDWDRAKAISKMTIELRKEFGSDARLAEFLGLSSKSEFSKLSRAGALAIEAEKRGYETMPSLSVVTEMLVIEGEKYGKQKLLTVLEYAIENESTVAEMRDYVKTFKKDGKEQEAKKANKPDAKDEKQEAKTVSKPDEKSIVEGNVNVPPLPKLNKALVWVSSVTLDRLTVEQRNEMAEKLNAILTEYKVAAAVMI